MQVTKVRSVVLRAAVAVVSVACSVSQASAEFVFQPTDDTYVKMNDLVYGDKPHLQIRSEGSGGIWEENVLIRFDLAEIPPGTSIDSATLSLWYFDYHDSSPAGRPLTCHRILQDWDEDTVTGFTLPDYVGDPCATSLVPGKMGEWMTWDVTEEVRAFMAGEDAENFGWLIQDPTYWGGAGIPRPLFRSKEYGDFVPYLTVVPEPAAALLLLSLGLMARRGGRDR